MKKIKFALIVLFLFNNNFAQTINIGGDKYSMDDIIPNDKSVLIGQLQNGISYYIKQNPKPENRAELRLVVNAGSILEDDDQLGAAHFVEHMAFNGTKDFPGQKLVDFLETIGMRFGADINAGTSFDNTIYNLQVRTDSAEYFEKAFSVLSNWAYKISFDPEEVEKERGVIIEEWRLRRGASARIFDKHSKILFKDSRYSLRIPIGKPEIINSISGDRLKDFYDKWYRPDLMAVIAVGDFDADLVEKLIKKEFDGIGVKDTVEERKEFDVPDHDETLVSIVTDEEATVSNVTVYYKQQPVFMSGIGDFRYSLLESFFYGMFNQRLYELAQSDDPPFLNASAGSTNLVRTKGAVRLSANVKENEFIRALKSILTEAERIKQFGFLPAELERQKKNALRGLEVLFNEKDKLESANFVGSLVSNYLLNNSYPSIESIYEMETQLLPLISLQELNELAQKIIPDSNRVVVVSAPEDSTLNIPTEKDMLSLFEASFAEDLEAYSDTLTISELLEFEPEPGKIVKSDYIPELDVTELKLSNGVKVVLKPTDFQNDEIIMSSFSPGGTSLLAEKDYYGNMLAGDIIQRSGLGKYNQIELNKMLTGKYVAVYPFIRELREGLQGRTSPYDIKAMFEIIYMYFTQPRIDTTAFKVLKSQLETFIKNRDASPGAEFSDTLNITLTDYNYRTKPWDLERIDVLDEYSSFEFYKDRFADASDFIFFFAGNFEIERISAFIEKYIASLPAINRIETWQDSGIRYPKGIIRKKVFRGIEPKSLVNMNFTGDFEWNLESQAVFRFMNKALEIKLREVLREDESGTYGVSVSGSINRYPYEDYRISIGFGADPERVDELISIVFEQIDSLKNYGLSESYLGKAVVQQINDYEKNLKRNNSWINYLENYYYLNLDPRLLLSYPDRIKDISVSDLRFCAEKYYNYGNYIEVVLFPEEMEPK